jgi:uncharacterized protein
VVWVSDDVPARPGVFASTRIRILFGLSGLIALVCAGLLVVVLIADVPPPPNMAWPPNMAPPQHAGEAAPAAHGAEVGRETPAHDAVPAGEAAHAPAPAAETPAQQGQAPHVTPAVPKQAPARAGVSIPVQPAAVPPQQAAAPIAPALPIPLLPPPADGVGALSPAPDPGLVEQSPDGLLPKIGVDGRQPWQVYARPFNANEPRPRVAVVLTGLGLSSAATESAIQGLPGGVTLAFQPYADNLQQWINLARAAGHEVLLNVPLEPLDYPKDDPGPQALFTAFAPAENLERLNWALSQVTGYVGVSTHMGSRFTTSRDSMAPIIEVMRRRGLLFLDTRSSARSVGAILATENGVPRAINDRFLDAREVSRVTIDARLAEVELIAREVGVSIAVGQAYPVTIERIALWVQTLGTKGLVLAPISAVAGLQADR